MVGACVAWALLFGAYLLFAGQVSADEIVAGTVAGVAGAVLSSRIRRVAERRFVLRAPWGRVARRIAASLVSDTGRVAMALTRAVMHGPDAGGSLLHQPFARDGATEADAGRRAIVVLAASLAPNAYVLRIAEDRDEMLLHCLVPHRASPGREWPL